MNFEDFTTLLINIDNVTKNDDDIINMVELKFKIKNINFLLILVILVSLLFNYGAITHFIEKISMFGFAGADFIYLTYFIILILVEIFVLFIFKNSIKRIELKKYNNSKLNKLPRNYEFYKEYITVTTEKSFNKYSRTDFNYVCMNKNILIFVNKNYDVLEAIPIKALKEKQYEDMIEYLEYTYASKFYNYK